MRRERTVPKSRMLRLGGPQNRLTDHRINKSWHNLEGIIEGKIEKIITEVSEL